MKTLVVYYSRSGHTKKVAEEMAQKLSATIEEIIDLKNRRGFGGFLVGCFDTYRQKLTRISSIINSPNDFDLIIIGTPVWGWKMTPAIRTYLSTYKMLNKKVVLFATSGGENIGKTFVQMKELLPEATIIGRLHLWTKDFKKNLVSYKIDDFINDLKNFLKVSNV